MSARSTETANEHLPPPRALFFDLDDTLAGFTSARHAASRTVAEQIAAAVPGVSAQEIVASACEALTDRTRAEAGYRFALANSWEQVKEDYYRLWRWPSRGGP